MTSNVEIIIDNRESLIFKTKIKKYIKNHKINIKQLPLGDIIILKNNITKVIIERKIVSDFVNSHFGSGRGKEQIWRLRKCNAKIIYIIEGVYNKKNIRSISLNYIYQAITNIIIRDNISIIISKNIMDTIMNITRICKCLTKYDINEDISRADSIEQSYRYVGGKSKNITPKIYFEAQLRLIPGIGKIISQEITKNYNSLYEFIIDCKNNPNKIYNNKKIGKKRYDTIIKYLC